MRLILYSYKVRLFTTDLDSFKTTVNKMWLGKLLEL